MASEFGQVVGSGQWAYHCEISADEAQVVRSCISNTCRVVADEETFGGGMIAPFRRTHKGTGEQGIGPGNRVA